MVGRTHLQDATPVTLGQGDSGWAAQLEQAIEAFGKILPGSSHWQSEARQLARGSMRIPVSAK